MPDDTVDRSLPYRTLMSGLLVGLLGVAVADAIVGVLAHVGTPSFERYIRPVQLDAELRAISAWAGSFSPWHAWLAGGVAALAFPFLLNRRWLSRKTLTTKGLAKLVATIVLIGIVDYVIAKLIGLDEGGPFARAEFPSGQVPGALDLAPALLIAGVGTAIVFVVAGELTLGGSPEHWWNPEVTRRSLLLGAACGFLAGTVGAAATLVVYGKTPLLRDLRLYSVLSESAEMTLLGWKRLYLGHALALGLLGVGAGALIVALSPSRAGVLRRSLSIILAILPIATLVVLDVWLQRYLHEQGELKYKTLAEAASLEGVPSPRLMALPTPKGPRAFAYPLQVTTLSGPEENIAATKRNIDLLRSYLAARRGKWTVHTMGAWEGLIAIQDRLLDPEGAVRAQYEATVNTGSILWPQLLALRLAWMPLSPETRKIAEALTDAAKFKAGSKKKDALGEIALNLRLRAEEARALTGRVFVRDNPATSVRVGLFRVAGRFRLDRVPHSFRLLAATTTDETGAFAFRGLRPASYFIGILLPERLGQVADAVAIDGNLGPFDLTTGPADAGLLRLWLR